MEIETLKGLKKGETYWVVVGSEKDPANSSIIKKVSKKLKQAVPECEWVVTSHNINIKEVEK